MSEPRYVYDLNEGFFVDMGDPDPDDPTMGSEMYVTEVADRLNELEAKLSKMERAAINSPCRVSIKPDEVVIHCDGCERLHELGREALAGGDDE